MSSSRRDARISYFFPPIASPSSDDNWHNVLCLLLFFPVNKIHRRLSFLISTLLVWIKKFWSHNFDFIGIVCSILSSQSEKLRKSPQFWNRVESRNRIGYAHNQKRSKSALIAQDARYGSLKLVLNLNSSGFESHHQPSDFSEDLDTSAS
jgi:hypothetical protein